MPFEETWGLQEEPDPYTCAWCPASPCLSKLRLEVATLEEWRLGNTAIPFLAFGYSPSPQGLDHQGSHYQM